MPRPKSKAELLALSQANASKLLSFVQSLPDKEKDFPPGTMNRNIRDVLGHLHHWHMLMLTWYKEGMAGKKPVMPAPGYSWKTVPELNREILRKYQKENLENVLELFDQSFGMVQAIIEKHTQEELFEKKRYPWTGSTSLGSYLISATSSHHDWALKLIKKAKK